MQQSDLFAYLAAFVTIVLAIALSDMMQSTHRLIRARDRVKWDVLPLLAALFVYLTILSEFFSLWDMVHIERFTFYRLVWMMSVPSLISLAAFAVLPDDVPDGGLDLSDFYLANRRYLASLIGLYALADVIRNLFWAARAGYLDEPLLLLWWGSLAGAMCASAGVMWFARNRALHLGALIALLVVGNIAYFKWVIEITPKG